MRSGLCCGCKVVLTSDNSCLSVLKRRAGYCRECRRTRKGSGFCSGCKVVLDESNSTPYNLKIRQGYCRTCKKKEYTKDPDKVKIRAARWAESNPERRKEIAEKYWLRNKKLLNKRVVACYRKKEFGITQAQFDARFVTQNGLCAICKQPMVEGVRRRIPCQDHDHVTNKLRDLLCSSCNLVLGNCYEKEEILVSAILYLRKHADDSSTQIVCENDTEQNLVVA